MAGHFHFRSVGILFVGLAVLIASTPAVFAQARGRRDPAPAKGPKSAAEKPAAAKPVGELARLSRHRGTISALAVSHDGKYIATAGEDGLCCVVDAGTLEVSRLYGSMPTPLTGVAFMRDLTVVTSCLHDKKRPTEGSVKFWDWKAGAITRVMPDTEMDTYAIQLSPDDQKLGVTFRSKDSRMYHIPTNSRFGLETPHRGKKCLSVAFRPDSNIMAAGIGGGITLWHVGDEQKGHAGELPGENDSTVSAVEFSPDGMHILTAHADGVVRIWRDADPPLLCRLAGHTGEVHDATFSPDGKQIATAGQDKTVRLWDVATAKELRRFAGHTGAVTCVAFAGRQDRIVSAGADGTVRLWRTTDSQKTPPVEATADAPIEITPLEPTAEEKPADNGRIRPAKRGKIKMPDTQKVQQASALLKDVFSDDFARAVGPSGKQKLAAKLLAFGREPDNEAAERFAAIQTARDIAIEGSAVAEAVKATSELGATFDVDDVKLLVDTIEQLAKNVRLPQARATLIDTALRLVDETLLDHRYAEAERLAKAADAVSKSARKADLTRRVRDSVASIASSKARWSTYQAALGKLKTNADDPEANLAVGKHLLADGAWSKALRHLAKSSDAALKEAATADLAGASEPDQQISAAQRWQKAAETLTADERKICLALAAHWYDRALPALTGLRKLKIEKELKAIGEVPALDRE